MEARFDELLRQLRAEVATVLQENETLKKGLTGTSIEGSRCADSPPKKAVSFISSPVIGESMLHEQLGENGFASPGRPKCDTPTLSKAGSKKSGCELRETLESNLSFGDAPGVILDRMSVRRTRTAKRFTVSSWVAPWEDFHLKTRMNAFLKGELVFNPEQSNFLKWWDVLTFVGLLWAAAVVPVQVSLSIAEGFGPFFFLNLSVDSVFVFDFILQFFVMFPRETATGYVLVGNLREIRHHYLRNWFAVDFLSIFPFDLLASVGALSKSSIALKCVRILRLVKLTRLSSAFRIFSRYEARMTIAYSTISLVKCFTCLLFVAHWLACLWCSTLKMVSETGGTPRWVDVFAERDANVAVKTKDSQIGIYVQALYFIVYTITTVGYGDIGPLNMVETSTLLVVLVVAGVSWALILGQVCGIVSNMNQEERVFRETMDNLNYMMRDRGLNKKIQTKLRSFFLSKKTALRRAQQVDILNLMSPGLQGEVIMQTSEVWLVKVPYFKTIMERARSNSLFYGFLVEIARSIEFAAYAFKEVFGERHQLYILTQGIALGRKVSPFHFKANDFLLTSGSVWGTDFMVDDKTLQYPPAVHALQYCECLTLKRGVLLRIAEQRAESCRDLHFDLRRYTCWLSFQRAFLREARRRWLTVLNDTQADISGCYSSDAGIDVEAPAAPPALAVPACQSDTCGDAGARALHFVLSDAGIDVKAREAPLAPAVRACLSGKASETWMQCSRL